MPIETYRLDVRETAGIGIDADVSDEADMIVASTHVSYDDYDLDAPAPESRDESPSVSEAVTADVTTIDLQFERDDAGFVFRVLGDRDELAAIRVTDDDWGLD